MNTDMNLNPSPSPAKKKNTTLIVVGVILGLCLVMIVAGVLAFGALRRLASRMVSMDPAVAAETAHRIADYDLPAGYSEIMSMTLPIYQFVIIGRPDPYSNEGLTFILAQFPNDTNMTPEEMERQFAQSYNRPGMTPANQFHVVDTRTMTIRGSQTEAIIGESVLDSGTVVRQLMAVFPGKSGQAMMMIQSTTDYWDEQVIDDFIKSIR